MSKAAKYQRQIFCHSSVIVNQRWQGNFSRVSLVLAVGSMLTFNPSWVTGVCWCAEEGQEGTLLPRPLRSHAGNSWAASDSGVRGNVTGSTGVPLGDRLTLRHANPVDSHMHHIHVHMHVFIHPQGFAEVSVRQHAEWRMHLNRGHLQDRNCQENRSFEWL